MQIPMRAPLGQCFTKLIHGEAAKPGCQGCMRAIQFHSGVGGDVQGNALSAATQIEIVIGPVVRQACVAEQTDPLAHAAWNQYTATADNELGTQQARFTGVARVPRQYQRGVTGEEATASAHDTYGTIIQVPLYRGDDCSGVAFGMTQ